MLIPKWERYYGNNHHNFPRPKEHIGGYVSFKKHLGEQLSHELWDDLVNRLQINGLCIYRPDQETWSVGWPYGHCDIFLDDEGKVIDICFLPYITQD